MQPFPLTVEHYSAGTELVITKHPSLGAQCLWGTTIDLEQRQPLMMFIAKGKAVTFLTGGNLTATEQREIIKVNTLCPGASLYLGISGEGS